MHFVSSQTEAEQITDIVDFFCKNIDSCISLPADQPKSAEYAGF